MFATQDNIFKRCDSVVSLRWECHRGTPNTLQVSDLKPSCSAASEASAGSCKKAEPSTPRVGSSELGPSGCPRCEPVSVICSVKHLLCSCNVNIFILLMFTQKTALYLTVSCQFSAKHRNCENCSPYFRHKAMFPPEKLLPGHGGGRMVRTLLGDTSSCSVSQTPGSTFIA